MNIITDNKKDISFSNGVDVLSLFDGMACGMLAMRGTGLKVNNYYAYEIDKYAIKTVLHNFPEVQELGDVFDEDFSKYENIDFLMGGSPCTYWSIAQSPDKRETTASGLGWELFSQYVRAIKEAKPKYFIYENNKSMAKAIYESISETFGFEPIMINSALVSAQNRQRYYWVGKRNEDGTYSKVDIEQPEDRGILLKDVLDGVVDREKSRAIIGSIGRTTEREYFKKFQRQLSFELVGTTKDGKSYCLTSGYSNGSGENIENYVVHTLEKGCKSMVAEPVNTTVDGKSYCLTSSYYKASANPFSNFGEEIRRPRVAEPVGLAQRGRYGENGIEQHYEVREDGKSNCLTTVQKDTLVGEPVNSSVQVGALPRPNGELSKSQAFRIYDTNAKSVTLKSGGGGAGGKTGLYAVPVSPVKVGEVGNGGQGNRIYDVEGKSVTLQANSGGIGSNTGLYAIPFEFQDLTIRNNAHITINDNVIRGVQNKNNASCAENFYEFTDTKANTLTTAHRPKIIDELSNYTYYAEACEWNENGEPTKATSFADGKKYTVYTVKDGQITIKEKQYPIKLKDGYYIIRKLTVSECKRLQTVPEWYEFPVSDTQGYKMLGNCWTVDVIIHLIKSILG